MFKAVFKTLVVTDSLDVDWVLLPSNHPCLFCSIGGPCACSFSALSASKAFNVQRNGCQGLTTVVEGGPFLVSLLFVVSFSIAEDTANNSSVLTMFGIFRGYLRLGTGKPRWNRTYRINRGRLTNKRASKGFYKGKRCRSLGRHTRKGSMPSIFTN